MPFLIVFGACLIVFGAVYVIATIVTKRSFQGPANWPKAAGEVLRAFVYRHERRTPQETSITFTPVVEYAYTVAGQRYTSEKRDFVPYYLASYPDERQAATVAAAFPAGKAVTVRYNPIVPAQAALKVGKPWMHNTVLLFGVVNAAMGVLMIVLAVLM
ncbi:MAG TPA: DUF3592 domain-containing protein [Anaerolineae bacterium]|mgnify:CR=1 FL=1|nr:DUF3592 domain-containing protein [Anaerolineae bacterium]HQK14160.1 DUF3592 domain-containing protein [Anaerolineae bacterium]